MFLFFFFFFMFVDGEKNHRNVKKMKTNKLLIVYSKKTNQNSSLSDFGSVVAKFF